MSELYTVTNEPLTGGGIFSVMDPLGVPWEDYDMALELDMAYYGNHSGSKITSPLVDKLLENGVLSDAAMLKLATIILSINARRWSKEWDTLFADYDPISNYDMTEEMSEEGETNYGHTRTRTDNLAHTETRTDNLTHTVDGSEVEIPNVIMTEQESVRAFNSGSDQPSTKTTQTPQGNNRTDNDVTEHDTGTQAVQGTNSGTQSESEGGADSNSRDYTLTRRGNIGVTTSQQMLTSERELWLWNYFLEVVFPDVDKVLTTPVYLVTALSDESAGGITPTGTKNIYANGSYDVTNYAEALVDVSNSYDAEDEGKVVSNGELVEQGEYEISHNGPYNTTLYKSVWVDVQNSYSVEDLGKVVATVGANRRLVEQTSREITENGTFDTTTNNEVNVSIQGFVQGFELYAADFSGYEQTIKGVVDNQYFVCFFHDNMSANYTLNGETYTFVTGGGYNTQTRGATKAVANNTPTKLNAIVYDGSSFSVSHGDSGSYINVVGGWCGYPSGGTIYEQMATGITNSIIMNSAHERLLVFVGASQQNRSIDTVDINGVEYNITNNGAKYENVYGEYGAIEIDNNSDATIVVTFPASCYNYVSIVGLD